MSFAEIHVGLPVDGPFIYKIKPGQEIRPGTRVRVPFGKKIVTGFVVGLKDEFKSNFKIKEILEVIDSDEIFDNKLLELAYYTSENYLCKIGEILSLALPSGKSEKNRFKVPFPEKKDYLFDLSKSQKDIYDEMIKRYNQDKKAHLLYGITGSGKTELYISVAKYFIESGKSVIFLVPEINLTSQIYKRLYYVFGDDLVLYHSRLTQNQRLENWKKFYSGEVKIAIGTRSAIFLQTKNPGLIIVDEEHDGSYKENSTPRYNARRLALFRSTNEKFMVIFGSATPSLESMYAAENNILSLHSLTERYGDATLPKINVVEVDPKKSEDILSPVLMANTQKVIREGFQAIFLLNRRGFAPIIMCGSCKSKVDCPHCNISMNYHKDGNLLCHYCGHTQAIPLKCPSCNHNEMIKIGAGTQRVEEIIGDLFKNYRVKRLDQDSSKNKNLIYDIVKSMESGEIDLLIGTQMVSKGFDFSKVVLVGVLMADIGINLPDFRSSERIFSMLTQISGRSGRGKDKGQVVIQTLNQDNDLFKYLINHDYIGFYKNELEIRRLLDYPPFSRIIRILLRGQDESKVIKNIEKIYNILKPVINDKIMILGPSPAPIEKIGGNYRHHLILKSKNMSELRKAVKVIIKEYKLNDPYMEIDVDPYDML